MTHQYCTVDALDAVAWLLISNHFFNHHGLIDILWGDIFMTYMQLNHINLFSCHPYCYLHSIYQFILIFFSFFHV
jgi:hypothetical protein